MSGLSGVGAVLALFVVTAGWAAAEEPPAIWRPAETADQVLIREHASWDRHLHDLLGLPRWIDVAVEQRTRFEYLNAPFRPGEPETQRQFPQRTRLRAGADSPWGLRAPVELQDARVSNAGPNDFTRSEIDELDFLQIFVSSTVFDLLGTGLRADAHVGRLTLDVASRRLFARNAFRNTANAFDGVHLQIGSDTRSWRVRGFFTWPVERKENTFDDEIIEDQRFWGVAYEDLRATWYQLDAYYLGLAHDAGSRHLQTVGVRSHSRPKAEQVDYEIEGMGQFGRRSGKDVSAGAAQGEVGYTLAWPWTPRVTAQLDFASGTDDPTGDESHTFDPLFGARRFDFMPTGIYGPFARSNVWSPGVRILVNPRSTLRGQVKVRYWALADAKDAFVGTGLRDPTGDAGRDLGTDVELRVQCTPFPWLLLDAGYDRWFKGSYIDRVPDVPTTQDTDYFYLESTVRF